MPASRTAAEAPPDPECDNAAVARGEGTNGTADTSKNTASSQPAQPAPRWEVRTRKHSGAVVVFHVYSTLMEATTIARRLGEVGGNAHVVEVRHD